MDQSRTNENKTLVLADGRIMCYADYGSTTGRVIVHAHGGLSCRLDVAAADRIARQIGVRIIAPDRPGIGRSDPQPGRTILDWADDVSQLLDYLGIECFAATGWSMGGQYAAALGKALRTRVDAVAIIAGALPLVDPAVFAELPTFDRMYTRLSQRASWLGKPCFWATGAAARCAPGAFGQLAARQLGPADSQVLHNQGLREFGRVSAEAFRQPAGVVEDYRVWVKPWGFELEDLGVPVHVWQGADDQLVPSSWSSTLTDRIPGSTLHVCSGGHFLAHLHYQEIFEALVR